MLLILKRGHFSQNFVERKVTVSTLLYYCYYVTQLQSVYSIKLAYLYLTEPIRHY